MFRPEKNKVRMYETGITLRDTTFIVAGPPYISQRTEQTRD